MANRNYVHIYCQLKKSSTFPDPTSKSFGITFLFVCIEYFPLGLSQCWRSKYFANYDYYFFLSILTVFNNTPEIYRHRILKMFLDLLRSYWFQRRLIKFKLLDHLEFFIRIAFFEVDHPLSIQKYKWTLICYRDLAPKYHLGGIWLICNYPYHFIIPHVVLVFLF